MRIQPAGYVPAERYEGNNKIDLSPFLILGIDQPKISALKHGKLSGFSIERLFFFLRALDQCIDITIQKEPKDASDNMIHVAYA